MVPTLSKLPSLDWVGQMVLGLRYHGRWIFMKNAKNLLLAVQIEKTEITVWQKEWGKSIFTF